ncbi:hypothetical protein EGR_10368 [Echinococcus granulosus]|uniref:Uncharacterized protein n=1 Tax=Echinococcus granulosus TaxID=6210 RepID=W6UMQ3_ECHGR|nr:hypothetical protein EGR_10368 [Echinococcus granulosus]EUB54769.1 hypothetical protein EGR_10368 [Echinococcus granulosus]
MAFAVTALPPPLADVRLNHLDVTVNSKPTSGGVGLRKTQMSSAEASLNAESDSLDRIY